MLRKVRIGTLVVIALTVGLATASVVLALFINSSFETGDFTGWNRASFINPGLTGGQPFTGDSIVRDPGGSTAESVVLGPFAPMSQVDEKTDFIDPPVKYPKYGEYVARINAPDPSNPSDPGNLYEMHSNMLTQTTIIMPEDVDDFDNKAHVRFAYAPVLDNPPHQPHEQPWFYVAVHNVTRGNDLLYERFAFAGQEDVPWLLGVMDEAWDGDWLYLPWQIVDIAPGNARLRVGDEIEFTVIAAACAEGAHGGYVYVDNIDSDIPGLYTIKSAPRTTTPNAELTYKFMYRNGDPAVTQHNVVVRDTLPSNVTYVSNTGGCTESGGVLTCELGDMDPGQTGTFEVVVRVDASVDDLVINGNYGVESDETEWTLGAWVETIVVGLELDKAATTVGGEEIEKLHVGDEILYTIVATNKLAEAQTGIVITDSIPLGTTYVADSATTTAGSITGPDPLVLTVDSLAASDSVTLTFRVKVNEGTEGETIANRVVGKSNQQENESEDEPDPPPPVEEEDLRLEKTVADASGRELQEGDKVFVGDELLYTITATNMLETAASNVVITDSIPTDTTYVEGSAEESDGSLTGPDPLVLTVANLNGGDSVTLQFRVTVNASAVDKKVSNTVSAKREGGEEEEEGPIDIPDPVEEPGLTLEKAAEDLNAAPLLVGDLLRYTITATNATTETMTNVVITDAIPAHTKYVPYSAETTRGQLTGPDPLVVTVPTLGAGDSVVLEFLVQVDADADGASIDNAATANCDSCDEEEEDPPPDGPVEDDELFIEKSVTDVNGEPLLVGEELRYVITATNISEATMNNVAITDHIPAHTTYVADSATTSRGDLSGPDPLVVEVSMLAAEMQVVFEFRVTVDADAVGEKLENTVEAESDEGGKKEVGPFPGPDPEPEDEDLRLEKGVRDVNGTPLLVGDVLWYYITATNMLNTPMTNVVITDAIPANTTYLPHSARTTAGTLTGPDPLVVTAPTLAAGESVVLDFRVQVNADAAGQQIANKATAKSNESEEQEEEPEPVGPVEEEGLFIEKGITDVDGAPLNVDDILLYTITATNRLAQAQTNVVIADYIPEHTTFIAGSAQTTRGTLYGPDPLRAMVTSLGAGEQVVISFRVTVKASAVGKKIENSVIAQSDQEEQKEVGPFPAPDVATLLIRKFAECRNGKPPTVEDEMTYSIIVINVLTETQTNLVLTDTLPAYITLIPGSVELRYSEGEIVSTDPNIVVEVPSLAPRGRIVLSLRVTVDAEAEGQRLVNVAHASSDQQYPAVEAETIEDPTNPPPRALALSKFATDLNGWPLRERDYVHYVVTVTNMLDQSQENVVITDPLPEGTSYVADSASVSRGSIVSTDPLMADVGLLGVEQSAVLEFQVKVDRGTIGTIIANEAQATSARQTEAINTWAVQPYPDPIYHFPDKDGGLVVDWPYKWFLPCILKLTN